MISRKWTTPDHVRFIAQQIEDGWVTEKPGVDVALKVGQTASGVYGIYFGGNVERTSFAVGIEGLEAVWWYNDRTDRGRMIAGDPVPTFEELEQLGHWESGVGKRPDWI